jgi:hypothetical protein
LLMCRMAQDLGRHSGHERTLRAQLELNSPALTQ